MKTEDSNKPDYSHWAKKFDKVKHIYGKDGNIGTVCRSVGACLGNNYATVGMPVCPTCLEIQKKDLEKENHVQVEK